MTTRAFNPERTPLTDWLAGYVGWEVALLVIVGIVITTALILARAWRATGQSIDAELRRSRADLNGVCGCEDGDCFWCAARGAL